MWMKDALTDNLLIVNLLHPTKCTKTLKAKLESFLLTNMLILTIYFSLEKDAQWLYVHRIVLSYLNNLDLGKKYNKLLASLITDWSFGIEIIITMILMTEEKLFNTA